MKKTVTLKGWVSRKCKMGDMKIGLLSEIHNVSENLPIDVFLAKPAAIQDIVKGMGVDKRNVPTKCILTLTYEELE